MIDLPQSYADSSPLDLIARQIGRDPGCDFKGAQLFLQLKIGKDPHALP